MKELNTCSITSLEQMVEKGELFYDFDTASVKRKGMNYEKTKIGRVLKEYSDCFDSLLLNREDSHLWLRCSILRMKLNNLLLERLLRDLRKRCSLHIRLLSGADAESYEKRASLLLDEIAKLDGKIPKLSRVVTADVESHWVEGEVHAHFLLGSWLILVGAIQIVYASPASISQRNLKRRIAYSSISHMGFVAIGIGSLTDAGINGAILQMISHGLIGAALFFLAGTCYDRTHTSILDELGGIATSMPKVFTMFSAFSLASLALPGMSGFVSEFLVFLGVLTNERYSFLFKAFSVGGNRYSISLHILVIDVTPNVLWLQVIQRIKSFSN